MLNYQTFKENWKRYAFSSLVTFLAGFLFTVTPEIKEITLESFKNGALSGIIFIGVRAGVKALFEYLMIILK